MNLTTSRILRSLNESYNEDTIEMESTVGVDDAPVVRQCACGKFYKGNACPECGSTEGTQYKKVSESLNEDDDEEDDINDEEMPDEEDTETNDSDDKELNEGPDETNSNDVVIKPEDQIIVKEGLSLLRRSKYREFNESFGNMTSIKNGRLVFQFESYNVAKKLSAHQRAMYNLSEKLNIKSSNTAKQTKNESIKVSRCELMIKNESRAIKNAVARMLERQNVKFNYKKFNEAMSEFVKVRSANYRTMLEDIQEDDTIGKASLEEMEPDEVASVVSHVIEDTGLKVLDKSADSAGDDSVVVSLRVEDSPEAEVSVNEVKKVLSEVFDTPIDVEGPELSEGDDMVSDLEVIINPETPVSESEDEEEEEKITLYDDDDKVEECDMMKKKYESEDGDDDDDDEDEDDGLNESTKIQKVYILAESKSLRSGRTTYLKEDESGATDDDEEEIKTFESKEDAEAYLEENDLEDEYVPVPVDVEDPETDECMTKK